MPYSNLRSIAVFVGRANKPRWARSTKPPFYAGWPCSGPSCIVVKNPAGYISFCLNILYLNLMIQEAIVTWPVQTGWFRNDTIFKPVWSDYCWIFTFLFLYFIKGEKASAIDIAPKIDGFERPYFVFFHWIKLITIHHLITNLTF